MEFSDAKALITVDGARRKGKTAPIKQAVDEVIGDVKSIETIFVVKHTEADCEMQEGRDVWFHEAMEPPTPNARRSRWTPRIPSTSSTPRARPRSRRGILHTTGGYLTGVAYTHRYVFDLKPDQDVFWCAADVGWVTGHSYIVYGPLANGATSVMYEGAPGLPRQGRLVGDRRALRRDDLVHGADRDPRLHEVGPEYPGKHDLSSLRLLGSVGEPINPKAWLWYHKVIGGERCPIVDTWWQTETGNIMISPLPGITATKPGSATRAAARLRSRGVRRGRQGDRRGPRAAGADPALAGNAAHPLPRGRALRRDLLRALRTRPTWSATRARRDEDGYFWILGRTDDVINVSGHRLSTAEVESAVVSHPKVAEGGGDRPDRRGHRPGDLRLRDPGGRPRRHR